MALGSVALLAACGGGGSGSAQTIREAAEATLATGSAAFEQLVTSEGSSQVPDGTEIRGTGASSYGDPRTVHGTFDFGDLGIGTIEVIVTDTVAYLRGDVVADLSGDAETWLVVDLESTDPTAQQLGGLVTGQNDASLLLYYLFGVGDEVEAIGTETIGGVDATGYRISVDLEAALERVPPEAREPLQLNLDELGDGGVSPVLEAEAWIDGDGFVRRTVYVYDLGEGAGGGRIRVVSDLSAFGDPVAVEIPPPGEVVALEDVAA